MRLLSAIVALQVLASSALAQMKGDELFRAKRGGSEIVALFITMSRVGEEDVQAMKQGLDRVRRHYAAIADSQGVPFRAAATTTQWSPDSGWADLKRYGSFDEITVGGNWLNSAISDLVWKEPKRSTQVPQLIVYRRTVGGPKDRIDLGHNEVLLRLGGVQAIRDWSPGLIP